KALIAGHGSPLYFFNSALSTVLIVAAVVLVLIPLVRTIRARRRGAAQAAVAHPQRSAAMTGWDIAPTAGACVLLLVRAGVFTNGVEWLGLKMRISEGATGSILAAIGTATPETLIPVVAILFTNTTDSDEIGVGAILGAPFMLGTLVMLLIGVTAFVLRKKRKRNTLHVDAAHAVRDLSFFLVLYAIALGLALLPTDLHFLKGYLGWVFLPAYFLYLFLVLRTPRRSAEDIEEEMEEREAFDQLTFVALLGRVGVTLRDATPPLWLVLIQTIVAFAMIV